MHSKHPIAFRLALSFLAAVAFAAAPETARGAPPDPSGGTGGGPLAGALTVRVVAAGGTAPIAGAFVMAGSAQDVPFAGNIGFTNGSGEITFAHPALAGAIAVTAGAAGRAYVTILDLPVSEVVLPLPDLSPSPTARLGDQFAGIEVNNGLFCLGDGNLDLGFVFPAIPVDEAVRGGGTFDLSTTLEPLSTPQGPVLVSSNLYFPRQCEAFSYFEKSSYHLRASAGRRTLFGLTARASLTAFLNGQTLVDLIKAMSFREMDVLRDLQVTGNRDDADLNADLPLSANLVLQVENGQPGTQVLAVAGGEITASDGTREVIATGIGAFDPDTDGAAATLTLTTRPATGELSDLVHDAVVTQQRDVATVGNGSGSTTALIRSGLVPPATRSVSSFYEIVEIDSVDDAAFSWTDVQSASSPPAKHLNTSRLVLQRQGTNPDDPTRPANQSTTYWTLHSPGNSLGLSLPTLPSSAPTTIPDPNVTPDNDRLDLSHAVQFLGDDPDGFQYGAFALGDVGSYGTQVSANDRPLRCDTRHEIAGLVLARGSVAGQVVLSWNPSPDYCHDTLTAQAYEVYAGASPRPSSAPGAWPSDPPFGRITGGDLDGSLENASFTHVPPDGLVCYLVLDRGLSGNEGPAGHYGSSGAIAPSP